ncbi:TPA: hypothetical protein QDB23_000171 [Burkholderia vietnamiensis]|nr:hypothetical protein [Burkholderia vietnamiensis]
MELLKFATIVFAVTGIAKGIQLFRRYCQRRFGYNFFAPRRCWLAAIGISFLWWGYIAWGAEFLHHESTSGGLGLLAMGLTAGVCLIYENIRNTDLAYGVAGSALQLTLFFPVALYGAPLLAFGLLFLLFAAFKAGPTWFIDP